ncbi:MAG: hypothetical protein ACE3JN_03980 [Ectobacillus sp.]
MLIFISRTSVHHGYAELSGNPHFSSPSGFPLDEAELGPDRYDIWPGALSPSKKRCIYQH